MRLDTNLELLQSFQIDEKLYPIQRRRISVSIRFSTLDLRPHSASFHLLAASESTGAASL